MKLRRLARCSSLREKPSQGQTLASPLNRTLGGTRQTTKFLGSFSRVREEDNHDSLAAAARLRCLLHRVGG